MTDPIDFHDYYMDDSTAGTCGYCGEPFTWVRPGKAQETCECYSRAEGVCRGEWDMTLKRMDELLAYVGWLEKMLVPGAVDHIMQHKPEFLHHDCGVTLRKGGIGVGTSHWQDKEFAKDLLDPESLLESAIKWISDNLEPEDVFSEKKLSEWAGDSGYVKET